MHTRRLLSLSLPLLLAAALAPAGDWPRFRGPNGAGTSADKGVPVKRMEVSIEGLRTAEEPNRFAAITMTFTIAGVSQAQAEDLVATYRNR